MTYRTFDGTAQIESIVGGRYSSSGDIALSDGTATQGAIYFADDKNTGIYSPSNDSIAFSTAGADILKLNTGDVEIKDGALIHTGDGTPDEFYKVSVAGAVRIMFDHTGGGNVEITNPSGANITYGSSSDYRLKESETTISNALNTVKSLKPYQFTWKHDSKIGQGFFAHEVLETTPNSQAAIGTKDAVDSDSNPVYQQIDYSRLVPLLTAAIQELEAKVAALESA